ncbi:MAG: HisA/HisF-related TIM barrel protein [Pyrinomonadaceae bacterium]
MRPPHPGTQGGDHNPDRDPVEVAEGFEQAGARMLHIVDLDGAFSESNSRNREVLRNIIGAIDIPIQFGGGLRSPKDVEQAIGLGVTRVVIGTVAVESPETLTKMVHLFGGRLIAVGIDARNGQVVTHGWETQAPISALTLARRVAELGIERIVYTHVHRDGTLTGVNIDQTSLLASGMVTNELPFDPLILDHFEQLRFQHPVLCTRAELQNRAHICFGGFWFVPPATDSVLRGECFVQLRCWSIYPYLVI